MQPDRWKDVAWEIPLGSTVSLYVDPDLTINGLLELLGNSFRFGSSSIRCTTLQGPSHLSFVLHETPAAPPTIPPGRWGHEPLRTTWRGAYGLGLFRVRRIMEAQGGSLQVDYASTGNLLTTTASLPLWPSTP